MNNTQFAPVIVMGTPRSGTTLTAKILGQHPELFMPGETHFFDDVYSRREKLGSPTSKQGAKNIAERLFTLYGRYNEPDDQVRIEALTSVDKLSHDIFKTCADYEEVFSLFMTMQMSHYSKIYWGNNTPRDLFNVSEIREFYPNAKIIVCVRDPRDFLGSYKGKWRATANEEVDRLKRLYHPVITSYLWKANMKQLPNIHHFFPDKSVFILKYEELVTSPEKMVAELCMHIGVEFDVRMLEVSFSNSSEGAGSDKKIFTSSIGGWQKRISQEEAWIAQKICGPEMGKLGYINANLKINVLKIITYTLSAPNALWKALEANKHKRGPLIPYILKRVTSSTAKG